VNTNSHLPRPESQGDTLGISSPNHEMELLAGQVKLLFQQTPSAFCATLFNAIIVCCILWGQVPNSWLIVWVTLIGLLTCARYGLVKAYYKTKPSVSESAIWGRRFMVGAFLSGVLWGAAGGLFFVERNYIYQVFVAFVLAGMSAGAMSTLSSYRGAYLAFLAPAMIPYILRTMSKGEDINIAMTAMLMLFVIMMLNISKGLYNTLSDTLLLRLDNIDLLNELISARGLQNSINQELSIQISEKERAEKALKNINEELEQQVQRRTEELIIANDILQREMELFQVTLASIGDAVITTDSRGHILYLNPVAEQYTGWRNREAMDLPLFQVFRTLGDGQSEAASAQDAMNGEDGNCCILIRRNGQELAIDRTESSICDKKGNVIGGVLTFRDVTAQRRLAQSLAHQASHDPLTGLLNRHEFERRITTVLKSTGGNNHHALLYLDLDHFKLVNDTCGHPAGDELLRQVTALMQSNVRTRDTLARLGGDEFGILLEHCPLSEASLIAHSLLELVQGFRFVWQGKNFGIGVSIGLFPIDQSGLTLFQVLSAADSACYAAKNNGRNCIHVYQPGDSELLRSP